MSTGRASPGAGLGLSLLSALLVVALLSWALLVPSRAQGRSARPPLLTPVELDFINEAAAVQARPTPSAAESASAVPAHDGLRPW